MTNAAVFEELQHNAIEGMKKDKKPKKEGKKEKKEKKHHKGDDGFDVGIGPGGGGGFDKKVKKETKEREKKLKKERKKMKKDQKEVRKEEKRLRKEHKMTPYFSNQAAGGGGRSLVGSLQVTTSTEGLPVSPTTTMGGVGVFNVNGTVNGHNLPPCEAFIHAQPPEAVEPLQEKQVNAQQQPLVEKTTTSTAPAPMKARITRGKANSNAGTLRRRKGAAVDADVAAITPTPRTRQRGATARARGAATTRARARPRVRNTTNTRVRNANTNTSALVSASEPTPRSYASTRVRKKKEIREEDIEPLNKWWESLEPPPSDASGGGGGGVSTGPSNFERAKQTWFQMENHSYLFPPDYEKHDVPLIYDNHALILSYSAEELATYFAQCIGSGYDQKELFIRNFWESWHERMSQQEREIIRDFRKCDFSCIRAHLDREKERRKERPKEEKEAESLNKQHYCYALVNGIREKVGSYMVEPPQLFRGRGEHPKQGKLKERVSPEECILNCDPNAPVPRVAKGSYPGHGWKEVIHDDSVSWLAYYHQPGREEFKYLFLAPSSGVKGQNDLYKYEKARRLHSKIGGIRKDYRRKLTKSNDMQMKQLGTATFLIDRLALRVGGEKDTDLEADTVGCTSLRVEHLRFNNPEKEEGIPKVTFDFLGKDSVRYLNEIEVPRVVYDSLVLFTRNKDQQDQLFDKIDPSIINDYFKEFMHDLSAKVFRTYNASNTLEEQLAEFDNSTVHTKKTTDLVNFYNDANKKVAVLCNHQKGVAKSHSESITKLQAKFDALECELRATREQLQDLNKGSNRGILEGDQFTKLPGTPEACKKQIKSLKDKLQRIAHDITQKESNKNVSLSTSRINYMDPRITVAFCKRVNLEVKHLFSSTVIQKFPWALAALPDYTFRTDATINFEDALRETRDNMAKQGIASGNDADECGSEESPNEESRQQKKTVVANPAPKAAMKRCASSAAGSSRRQRLSMAKSASAAKRRKTS